MIDNKGVHYTLFLIFLIKHFHYKLKKKTNKGLLYRTGNSTQYSLMTYMGREFKKSEYMCMYNWFTLPYPWNYHNIVNELYKY